MKGYPSIPRSTGQEFFEIKNAYIFDKLDGRNVRVEWTKKNGWHKWGSRHKLFDSSHEDFAPAIPLFDRMYAEPLSKIATDLKWPLVTVYLELWQEHSLGGQFVPNEPYNLTLFDIQPYKQCMLAPKEFLRLTNGMHTARYLGQTNWTRGFVEAVWEGKLDLTFEGVVAKAGERHNLVRSKAKTQKWVQAVLARYGEEVGKTIVDS